MNNNKQTIIYNDSIKAIRKYEQAQKQAKKVNSSMITLEALAWSARTGRPVNEFQG